MGWLIYAISASNGGKPDEPAPMPRPGVGPIVSAEDITAHERKQAYAAAYTRYLRTHQGAAPPPGWDWEADDHQ
jgi:hypothetical protein